MIFEVASATIEESDKSSGRTFFIALPVLLHNTYRYLFHSKEQNIPLKFIFYKFSEVTVLI